MNGMESRNIASSTAGDKARRKGFSINRRVVNVRREEAVWISRGRFSNRRPVRMARTSGTRANSLRLWGLNQRDRDAVYQQTHPTVSPHVGSWLLSHMKLPTKAHSADISKVAGMNTEVATITGLTKMRRRNM